MAPYGQKWLTDMMLNEKPLVPYIVHTKSAHQVQFTKRKSSHMTYVHQKHPAAVQSAVIVPCRLQSATF